MHGALHFEAEDCLRIPWLRDEAVKLARNPEQASGVIGSLPPMPRTALGLLTCALALLLAGPAASDTTPEPERLATPFNLLSGHPTRTTGGDVNVVVEIPAGTNAKWETAKDGNGLVWERENGQPRRVRYLPYPANYGMVPGTHLAKEDGGDGDPLDVVLLGPARDRGAVVPARLIGVLHLLDRGEQDDKLLAVDLSGPLAAVDGLTALERDFPGVTQIVETWFAHYKGPGKIETSGFGDRAEALAILERAEGMFRQRAAEAR